MHWLGQAWVLAVAAMTMLFAPLALAQEQILDYTIEIDVRADGSLDVAEHITVRAHGDQIRRGLYRDFPTRYRDRFGNNVVVELEVLGVERDGRPEPWFTERLGNGVRINTGDDNYLPQLPGQYRYTLRYRSTRQLGFFAEHDELYWNAIGTGWVFPIARGQVEVRLPEAVPRDQITVEAYTGSQGAQGRDYAAVVAAPGVARWTLTRPLQPYEGLTIVLGFPKGVVAEPSPSQRLRWLLLDNLGVLVSAGGLMVLLAFCVGRWRVIGRDPRKGVVIARYDAPAGRSPAELRYVLRQGYDMRCFTSDLLATAVAGGVVIEQEARTLRKDLWRLERSSGAPAPTGFDTATALLASLFPGGAGHLELNQGNASTLQRATQAHAKALEKRLQPSHFNLNSGSASIAYAIAIGTSVAAIAISNGAGIALIIPIGVVMFVIATVFRRLIKAPTPEGRRLMDEAEGLKLYLSVAERDELKRLEGPGSAPPLDAARYQALLPYAVALDVEEAWTRKFTLSVGAAAAAAVTTGIAWYRGGRMNDLGGLAQAVSSGLNASIASASTPPGSSSGGGGGGSSGGGGGGGGGGGR